MSRLLPISLLAIFLQPALAHGEHQFVDGTYQTDLFEFKVPEPWYYAPPKKADKKNKARCLLNSRIQMLCEGLLIVDVGAPMQSPEATINDLTKLLQQKEQNQELPVKRSDEVLDGERAIVLTTNRAMPSVPNTVILSHHDNRIYLIFISVAKPAHLADRDTMLNSIRKTWSWK